MSLFWISLRKAQKLDNYTVIIQTIERIKTNLKYRAPELISERFINNITDIAVYLQKEKIPENNWALTSWNNMSDNVNELNKLLTKN